MPEGDTVANYARALHAALAGRVVEHSDFRVPRFATTDLAGWTVRECVSRGKHLLLRMMSPTGTAATLHSHLRMDGTWRTYAPGQRWHGPPAHTIRVVLSTSDVTAVGYHVHDVALVPTADEATVVGHLGPDLLGTDWDPAEAVRRLSAQPGRAIADALLDQRCLAGIGNVFATEMLFLQGINPWQPVGEVKDLHALVELGHRLLEANVTRPGHITTGDTRSGRENWTYGRAGRPCRRCGTLIRRSEQGPPGQKQLRVWCPNCQK